MGPSRKDNKSLDQQRIKILADFKECNPEINLVIEKCLAYSFPKIEQTRIVVSHKGSDR